MPRYPPGMAWRKMGGNGLVLLVAGVLFAPACGGGSKSSNQAPAATGGSSSDDDAGPIEQQLTAFCTSLVDANVSRLSRCQGLVTQVAQNLVTDPCVALKLAVAAGRIEFDPASIATCIADLRSLACEVNAAPSSCNEVLSGQVSDAASCSLLVKATLFSECKVGSVCVSGLTSSCSGTCAKLAQLNEACGAGVGCTSGATCSAATSTCVTKGALNAQCGLDSSPECQPGLACSNVLGGTCISLAGVGATCSSSSQCTPPAFCDRGASLTGTCQPPLKPGDSCTIDNYDCSAGLSYCGADSKCHAQPGIGQTCPFNDGENGSCTLGTCTGGVCTTIAATQSCSINADCGSSALCVMDLARGGSRCTASCL